MSLVPLAALAELSGRRAEALRFLDSAVSSAPKVAYARSFRSLIRSQAGDQAGARLDAEAALALDSNFTVPALAALARTLWRLGDTAGAIGRLAEAKAAMADSSVPTPTEARMVGSTLVDMHRLDEAVDLLRRVRPRGAWLWFYFSHTEFEALRRDPRAAAILAEADPRAAR
jgi:tetratricopeptide (TPR) repeat protein